ncbi:uncharacterized protein LTR77_005111 [Saxophila tyrrhenica]|uniref:Cytochrome P450 n=1 Tax=Saxophila tyrrhenica TaxID=1690608 RepID=A0AAV9PF31_9PEZI|nr:hypothetical protein LTR77_005111 [Saxophila tyrrhenica]
MWLLITTSLCLVATGLVYFVSRRSRIAADEIALGEAKGCEPPPKLPHSWPLALDLIFDAFSAAKKGRILQFFQDVTPSVPKTFEQVLLGVSGVDTADPENLEAMLSTQFKEFGLGARRPTFFPLLGEGIFTQDGVAWKASRDILRPQFMGNRAKNFAQMQEATEKLIDSIPGDRPFDLQPLFFRFTLATTTYLLFGKSIGALDESQDLEAASREAEFAEAFTVAQDYLAQRGRLGDLYWLIGGPKFWKACRTVHDFVDSMIKTRIDARDTGDSKYVFLDALLQQTNDIFLLRSQILNVLLAGRDTTACCLTWTLRLLSRHPAVLKKLRAEIEDQVGADAPTQQDLKRMQYLSFVLKEVLRLYPSVPVNSRTALVTTTLPRGGGAQGTSPVLLRKGTAVGYCPYLMHRREDLYGEDAEEFRPERWQGGLEKTIGWGYVPFNGGPRVCLGQEFAILEASYAIVRILQAFESIEPCAPPGNLADVQSKPGSERQMLTLVLSPMDGCWTVLKRESREQ